MPGQKITPDKAFLGVGVAFPPNLEAERIAMAVFEEDILQAIMIILGTNPGERVMRPDFGAGLNDFIFEPINSTTTALLRTRVEEALIDWEPRIEVEEVKLTTDPGERGKLLINIRYRVRASNTQYNLVYPFYLEEGTVT